MLRDATRAWDAGRPEEALARALDAWRASPSPVHGEVVERLSERVLAARGPLPGRTRAEKVAAWLRLGASPDPADVPRLLAALSQVGRAGAEDLVAAIPGWPRDPRVAAAILAFVEAPPLGYQGLGASQFWDRLLDALVAHADERSLPAIDRLHERFRGDGTTLARWMKHGLPWARSQVAARGVVTASADDEAAANELLARLQPAVRSGLDPDELLQAIYADPDDDDLRRVYADALLERGDPRGEFVLLQLQAAAGERLSREQRSRMTALEREHGRRWLGRIEGVVLRTGLRFERGFPAVVRTGAEQPAIVAAAVGAPEWATVRDLEIGTLLLGDGMALAVHPVMRSLRVLRGANRVAFEYRRELPIEVLALGRATLRLNERLPDAIVSGSTLPRLRELDLSEASPLRPEDCRALWDGLGARLDAFVVRPVSNLVDWLGEGPRVTARRLEIRATPHDPWGAVLERGPSGALDHVLLRCEWPYAVPYACRDLTTHLQGLEGRWARMEVQLHKRNGPPSPAQVDRLRAAAERVADEVVLP